MGDNEAEVEALAGVIYFASSWFPDITVPHHCQPIQLINERIAQEAADSWDQAGRVVVIYFF